MKIFPVSARLLGVLSALWAVVMLVLTLTPAEDMPRTPEWKLLSFDTAGHAGVFAVLAALAWPALRQQRRWPRLARRAGAAVLAGCILFGALIEVLQYAMHMGRHAEWTDLIGDTVGAALALLLVMGSFRWWQARRAALLAVVSFGLLTSAQAQGVDLARARRTIAVLASPKMHGRGYVKQGEHQAAAYLRGRLRQLGLQPLAPDFTQAFELEVNTFPGKLALRVTPGVAAYLGKPTPTYPLRPGADFIVAEASAGSPAASALAFRLDTSASALSHWPGLPPLLRPNTAKLAAPFLVLTARQEQRLATLPASVQQSLDSLPNRVVLVPKLTASLADTQSPVIRLEALDTARAWRFLSHQGPQLGLLAFEIDARLRHHYHTQNLAAFVRGRTQPDSFLVVTAHYDHLGMMGKKTYFPGANDNASGVALLLELAAHYARPENQPACSVAFLLFGAEEAGLVGSSYFVQHPLVPLRNIKFLFNLDLLGTGEEGATVVNGKLLPAAYQRLAALNDAHHYLPRLTARAAAANSDHYPFSQAGVPAFFMYTRGGSPAYHDVHDQPAALSLAGFAGAYGLVRDFLNAEGARP